MNSASEKPSSFKLDPKSAKALRMIIHYKEQQEEDEKIAQDTPYEDLPLHVNRGWSSKEAHQLFKDRLGRGFQQI